MSNSGLKYGSGRKKFIGSGLATDRNALDPELYTGSVLYDADDALLYYSNGLDWVQLQPPIIRRPVPIEATTPFQRRQLRITPFVPGPNYVNTIQWKKTTFFVSKNSDMSNASTVSITNYVNVEDQQTYNIDLSNTLGLSLGDTFYWQAQYEGTFITGGLDTGPSDRSKVQKQVFPDNVLDQPYSATLDESETDKLILSDFSSAFGYSYNAATGSRTYFELYNIDDVPGEDGPIYEAVSNTNPGILSVTNIPGLNGDQFYQWRGKYSVTGLGNTFWSEPSLFSPPYGNLVLYIDTTKVPPFNAGNKTFFVRLTTPSSSNAAIINWGDGTFNTVTTNTISDYTVATHDYTEDGIYRVEVGGYVDSYGDSDSGSYFDNTVSPVQANSQSMIINCTSFGSSIRIRSLTNMFRSAKNLNDVSAYLPTSVTSIRRIFYDATTFNSKSIVQWDTSRITDLGLSFLNCRAFNQDLSKWNTSNVVDMAATFQGATLFNSNISYWDTSKVRNMGSTFNGAISFNQNLSRWNTSQVTSMLSMFQGASNFNGNVSTWDTFSVTNMSSMFSSANNFNQGINGWDVQFVTNMSSMFSNARTFNQSLNSWNVSRVTNMRQMFDGASRFNQNLNLWNTSDVTDMSYMFRSAATFNSNIYTWNTSKVTNMQNMFNSATRFNQNLNSWNTSSCNNMSQMFLSASAFNSNVSTWNTSQVTNMTGMFQSAIVFNQNINNWNVANVTNMSLMFQSATRFDQNLNSWNTSSCNNMSSMFQSATLFNGNVSTWNTSNVTNMSSMFRSAATFNQNINNWNVANVTNMSLMFNSASRFNQNLDSWNTSSLNNIVDMFNLATSFNGNVSTWNTSQITNMNQVFRDATSFNQNINNWNVANVTSTRLMLYGASRFNQNLDSWNTSKLVDMTGTFWNATIFNGNVSTWNTSNTTNMGSVFRGTAFNQNVASWNTSKVTDMSGMFAFAPVFNQNVASWNTANVTNMNIMFSIAPFFDQNIASWNVSKVTNFESMFSSATRFNQDLSRWQISTGVTTFTSFLRLSNTSNTNFTRLLISFANQAKAANNNPKQVSFGGMSSSTDTSARLFYKPNYSTNNFGTAIQTGAEAVTYLFEAGSPVNWVNFDNPRVDNTP
jgi:surface protein